MTNEELKGIRTEAEILKDNTYLRPIQDLEKKWISLTNHNKALTSSNKKIEELKKEVSKLSRFETDRVLKIKSKLKTKKDDIDKLIRMIEINIRLKV